MRWPAGAPSTPPVVRRGDLAVDRARRRVSRAGQPISFTRKELAILEELLAADGAVVSAEELLERVWDEHADPFSRTVTVTIGRLRNKLGPPGIHRDRGRIRLPHSVTVPTAAGGEATARRWRVPRGVRVRLTVIYTSLFLLGGIILLALTFLLVSNSLGASGGARSTASDRKILAQCKAKANRPHRSGKESGVSVRDLSIQCQKAFAAGSAAGKNAQRDHTMHELELWSLVGLAALTVAASGLGWVMASRALRPVREITDAARRASERHLGERINLVGPDDELKELADTFDEMLDRLDIAFATQRQFVANASHELRTPLTAMRTAIDVVLAKPNRTLQQLEATVERVNHSTERAEHIIEALLTMVVSNQGVEVVEPVDLATAAEDALDAVQAQVLRSGLRLESDLESAPVEGNRVLLEQMVANLVQNAVIHNVPHGRVCMRSWSDGGAASFEVANSGPRVSPEELPGLFEPFRRAASRTGSSGVGLGLSIVRSVGDAHGAVIEAHPERDGGLIVTVTMPSRAARQSEPTHSPVHPS